jgi:acetyl esterase/lipase
VRPLLPSPLIGFNALMPKERGTGLVARGLVYGPHPRQRLDLYAPRRLGEKRLPAILFFYGGSWSSGLRQGYAFVGRALAARGFLVGVPDYRLVPEVRFPAFLEDGAAAFAHLQAIAGDHGGDPGRIMLAGHSAGAWLASMLALDPTWLGSGRASVRGLVGLAGPYDFFPFTSPAAAAAFAKVRDPQATQPVAFAAAGAPPALLLHGAEDETVKPRNSERLTAKLRAAGSEAEVRLYPRIGHIGMVTALALPFRHRAPVLADLADFARRVTAPQSPPVDRSGSSG